MVDDMYGGTFSIEWLEKEYQQYELSFLQLLNEMKGHIIQALFWLKNKPGDVNHRVQISLDVSETPIQGDFYLELYYEPDGKAMINIISIGNGESGIGFVRFPPQDTFSLDDWKKLGERYLELLKTMDRESLPQPRIVSNVSHESYGRLVALGEYYNKKVNEIVTEIVEVSSLSSRWITNRSEDYRVPVSLTNVISHLLFAGRLSTDSLFNDLLDRFEVKGLFVLSDLDINLDEISMWISFSAMNGCDLHVHSFDISLTGLARLEATYPMDVKKDADLVFSRLKDIVDNVRDSIELPASFQDMMDFDIDIDKEDENSLTLRVDITEETLDHLPLISDISDLFFKILDKSEMKDLRKYL